MFRNAIGTYMIVTASALLIWLWAASATREQSTLFVRVMFAVEGIDQWRIEPPQVGVTVKIEGSVRAIANAEESSRQGIMVTLPEEPGPATVDLIESLRRDPIIRASGVLLLSAEPAAVDVTVDRLEPIDAAIRVELPPGLDIEGPAAISPQTATVWMPTLRMSQIGGPLTVNATFDADDLERLEPGGRVTLQARLRLPESLSLGSEIDVVPSTVDVTMTVRSRVIRHTLESVRVHLAGPHEDFLEYDIRLSPSVLRDVSIEADSERVRQILAGEATVVAVLHLSNRDKEQGIPEKAVAYFALLRDGWKLGQEVTGEVAGSNGLPVIGLEIERRE